jgi:hypothetical protein
MIENRSLAGRSEQQLFDELAALCTTPGFAHVIAYLYFRDHVIGYGDELKPEDYKARRPTFDRLIRTEIATLIGLMARVPRDLRPLCPDKMRQLIDGADALLKELHEALQTPMRNAMKEAFTDSASAKKTDPFVSAAAMREPIFYGADSAFAVQYRELSVRKYARDEAWLQKHKGFSPEQGKKAVEAINNFLNEKLLATLKKLRSTPPDEWTFLDGFSFSVGDIAEKSGLELEIVHSVTDAFSSPEDGNPTFTSLPEFNSVTAYPIIKGDGSAHLSFLPVGLSEALYDTPFYWMRSDVSYVDTAMVNRGLFTEEFTAERLERVFGPDRVFRNVDIWETKARKKKLGEIDTLVLISDRAIVVQAKSKKLTLLARKGNDLQLQKDFKAAVQDACDQAVTCGKLLIDRKGVFTDATGREIAFSTPIKHVHPLCVVSDHYPALSFQARQFLKYPTAVGIHAPLVSDVFFIDVVTEFLETPLRFLSYLELRARAGDNVLLSHEIVALGFHLKQNLWLGENDFLVLDDDIATDLDIAMAARREGVPGHRTPPGILTHLSGTLLGRIVEQIEERSELGSIEVGLEILKLSGKSSNDLNLAIKKIAASAKDGKQHDVTIATSGESGLTIHCNDFLDEIAASELKRHCELRKYSQKAPKWFGLAIKPQSAEVRFGLMLHYPWKQDSEIDQAVAKMPKAQSLAAVRPFLKSRAAKRKIGRNEQCPCGSGLKYKKCCLSKSSN